MTFDKILEIENDPEILNFTYASNKVPMYLMIRHYYLAYIKFGLGRCTSDAAHEIRDGHITREEGVQLVTKFDCEFPEKYFKLFLEYCDIDEDYFFQVIDSWRSPHLWEKDDKNEWKLKSTVH